MMKFKILEIAKTEQSNQFNVKWKLTLIGWIWFFFWTLGYWWQSWKINLSIQYPSPINPIAWSSKCLDFIQE